jgi:hypothetical protein
MARRQSNVVRFPGSRGVIITDDEHRLLLSVVGPFYGAAVELFLNDAPSTPRGRRLDIYHHSMEALLGAISCECHGYQKLDDERNDGDGTPQPGSTAEQLLAIYDRLTGYSS